MNAAFINTLLSLIPTAFKLLYEQERMMNPKAVFQQCFDWFVIKYGCILAKDCETNWMVMATNWHPWMGFEVLTLCPFWGITFASLSGHPIMDKDTVDINVRVLNHTGHFPKEYKTWILRGNNASKTNAFVSFKTFWENAVQIAAFTTIPASQHGYGMATTNNNALARKLTYAVSNFGTAYATTQELLRSNTANILAMQGQLQMLCQAVGTGQPPQQQPRCPQGGCSSGQQCGDHNGGGNGGGGSGGGGGFNIGSGGYIGGSGSGRMEVATLVVAAATAAATAAAMVAATLDIRPQAASPPCR
jgi:hypothetical protein